MKIHSHYDNLKVSRDAPPEVIRAAYKSLSQMYHPDRRPDDPNAARVMSIINGAYDVLSDPEKRREHDRWIAIKEAAALETPAASQASQHQPSTPPPGNPQAQRGVPPTRPPVAPSLYKRTFGRLSFRGWVFTVLLVIGAWQVVPEMLKSHPVTPPRPYVPLAATPIPSYTPSTPAPILAPPKPIPVKPPKGRAWPTYASYLLNTGPIVEDQHSKVTVDNTSNSYGVWGKLVATDGSADRVVREFFIPRGQLFTLEHVVAGNYDIRYRNVLDGSTYKSTVFNLSQYETGTGVEYATVTITLYTVPGGNMRPVPISDAEF